MLQQYSSQIRRTAIVAATALAISLPGAANAGVFNKAAKSAAAVGKSVVKKSVTKAKGDAATAVTIVRKGTTAAVNLGQNLAQNVPGDLPGSELFELVQEFHLLEQLRDTVELVQQVQRDYQKFAGGLTGCKGECKAFRAELKALFGDLLSLTEEVPVLRRKANLVSNIERLSGLIDYLPARALYLMWQTTGDQIDDLRFAAENIRHALIALPPPVEMSDIVGAVSGAGSAVADSAVCNWVQKDKRPVIEWLQAELDVLAWGFKTIVGYIPKAPVKAEVGGEAGVAVANATAAGGASVDLTEPVKIGLKVAASIFEAVNQAIKVNTARAKLVCAGAQYVSN